MLSIAQQQGGRVVQDHITGHTVTRPATPEEAEQAAAEWNARCETRQVDPAVKIDGWGAARELRVWLIARRRLVAIGGGAGPVAVDAC
jgi:hypothetical protein